MLVIVCESYLLYPKIKLDNFQHCYVPLQLSHHTNF